MSRRRYTLLLVSHDTESSRSISVTSRALRIAASVGAGLALIGFIGIGSLIAHLGRLPDRSSSSVARVSAPSAEVAGLRARVGALRGILDTIKHEDARLRAVAGQPGADTSALLGRVVARLPSFLRDPIPARVPAATRTKPDSLTEGEASGAVATADSLVAHATGLTGKYRALADSGPREDSAGAAGASPGQARVSITARVATIGSSTPVPAAASFAPITRVAPVAGVAALVLVAITAVSLRHRRGRRIPHPRSP